MKGGSFRRPSPALVVAVIALIVAMAGTGYAATQLPNGSVGTKQLKGSAVTTTKIKANAVTTAKIKKNAVTGGKVKKGTLTGSDINLATLGTVPSAQVANSLAPMEATHKIGAPGEPGFEGGAFNVPGSPGFGFQPAGFYKDHNGIVHLQGFVVAGSPPLGGIFTLPAGFRPASGTVLFFEQFPPEGQVVLVGGSSTVIGGIPTDGKVFTAPEEAVSLDGISFRAES